MEKIRELRMTLIILLVGMFFFSGCFFSNKYEVAFKTNGGSEVENIFVKSGSTIDEPDVPVKEGYIFDGWYLDGEEFDFDTEVKSDMTLVAKWRKATVADNTNPAEEEKNPDSNEPTTTTTTNGVVFTTTVVSVKVKNTTTTTTKRVTTTSTTNNVTRPTELASTQPVTTTQVSNVDSPSPSIPEETTPPVERLDLKMQVIATELASNLEEVNEYKYIIDFNSDHVNVLSNIEENDLQDLLKSDKAEWIIYNNNGFDYKDNNRFTYETNYARAIDMMTLEGNIKTNSITIGVPVGVEIKYYTLDEVLTNNDVTEEVNWYINYPNVSITHVEETNGLTTNQTIKIYYYASLEDAINLAKENDTVSILKDITINNTIEINKLIAINGNNNKITYVSVAAGSTNEVNYLFEVNNITGKLMIESLKLDVEGFMKINSSITLHLKDIDAVYSGISFVNKVVQVNLILNNLSLISRGLV